MFMNTNDAKQPMTSGLQKNAHHLSPIINKMGAGRVGDLKDSLSASEEDFTKSEEMKDPYKPQEVVIDSISDLQKMSFLQIKNLPISKCRGDVFEAALKQAIELEKTGVVTMIPKTAE